MISKRLACWKPLWIWLTAAEFPAIKQSISTSDGL